MTGRVLVSHPHAAAVACAVAAALDSSGQLAQFVTGVAAAERSGRARVLDRLAVRRGELWNRIVSGVPGRRLTSLAVVELLSRVLGRSLETLRLEKARAYDALFTLHDYAVSRLPWPAGTNAVYAYEDGALRTFRRAARQGLTRIWDLPSPHWATVETMWREEWPRWPGAMSGKPRVEPDWKKRRKDEELALADVVSVASRFTRRSLEEAGCEKPIIVTPYGFPVDRFRPKKGLSDGPFTVLAVGTQDLRKGTPYLLEAWRRAEIKNARLRLIGPMKLTQFFLARYDGLYEHLPHLPRSDLEREYQAADLLAFPTLGDGFGLVMQEAMCCGTPVVTTRFGGGPECITHGEDGWIVPARSADALVDVLRTAASGRDRVGRMGAAARQRAESWTWAEAASRLVDALSVSTGQPGERNGGSVTIAVRREMP